MIKNFKLFSLITFSLFALTSLYPSSFNSVYACDPCIDNNGAPRSGGETWCSGGALYQCNTCNNQPGCIQTVPGESGNRCYVDPATHPPSEWQNCDNTCNIGAPDIYTSIIGTCACTPEDPAQINLLSPANGAVTPADYDIPTTGYQVRIDWQTLADWGENCFGGTTFNYFYELYISTSPGAQSGQRYRIHRNNPIYSDTNPTYGNKVAGSEFILTLNPGQTYYWTVRADNGAVFGPYSPERSFTVNTPPTAVFTEPSGAGQPPYNSFNNHPTLAPITLTVEASDSTSNLDQIEIYRRKFVQSGSTNWIWDGPEALVASDPSCSSGTCTFTNVWTPPTGSDGLYWFYVKTFDSSNAPFSPYGKCSGEPDTVRSPSGTISGWNYCGNASRVLFRIAPKVSVEGYFWDATGLACTDDLGVIQSNALTSSDLDNPGSLQVSLTTVGLAGSRDTVGFNGNPASNPSYRFENRNYNSSYLDHTLSVNNIFTSSDGFRYALQCASGPDSASATATVQSNTTANFDLLNADNNVHLGFRKTSTGWITVTNGDVYSGFTDSSGISPSIVNTLPVSTDVDPNYDPYMFQNTDGVLYTGEVFEVKDVNGTDAVSSSDAYVRRIEPVDSWPTSYTYQTPPSAVSVTAVTPNCQVMFVTQNILTGNTYYTDAGCLNDGIEQITNAPGLDYRLGGTDGGIVVIYVEGSGTIEIPGNFQSNDNSRLVIITSNPVNFTRDVSGGTPAPTAAPNVEVAIMSQQGITFEGSTDPIGDPDDTIIVEGPLVVGDTLLQPNITMARDRGDTNETPALVVDYNPSYLIQLSKQIRAETVPNETGLSVVNISWEVE